MIALLTHHLPHPVRDAARDVWLAGFWAGAGFGLAAGILVAGIVLPVVLLWLTRRR